MPDRLFPDMPLPAFADPQNGSVLPAGGTSGVMPGLDAALLDRLRNYRPGDIGICELADKLQLTLPLPEWAWYCYAAIGQSAEADAGFSGFTDIYTMPTDRRAWVDGVVFSRAGGDDNTMDRVTLKMPPGYVTGASDQVDLKRLDTAGTSIIWPDPSGTQASSRLMPGPVLMEPGATLQVRWSGAGVAATAANYEILMRMTKLVRNVVP